MSVEENRNDFLPTSFSRKVCFHTRFKWLILNSSRDTIPPSKDDELLLFSLDNGSGKSVGSTVGILCIDALAGAQP
jgi:hypothetical protein